ncbi:MAG: sigma-70 family RNA polymerase sigma factor [Ruminococcus sp.]|uniref:sigma-70 family RNA polymerase sigma factor n=1 Tax=Ruminococcus sp. TaxID=41978 RepID=UPI0025FB08CA|nr:sigma-70 family RNA polymerase sigma factor [Ruminococcus sp.]MCR5599269.1 sigma-70 family RNA polymerase sigma factor [Ruminococcus sp.]
METETKKPLAEENLGLVHLCANRFRGRGIEYEDLYSAGCIGLLKAVKAFDSGRDVKFSTYAVPVILGEIKRLFRDGGVIRVSRSLKELAMRLQRICEEFRQREMREPTIAELSQLSGADESDVSEALCVSQPLLSLTSADDDEGQTDIPTEAPDENITDLLALRQIMSRLAQNDRVLLELRYFKGLTQSKTAKALGMTQVQVSRREKKLLNYMREELLK